MKPDDLITDQDPATREGPAGKARVIKPMAGDVVIFQPDENCGSWWKSEKPGIRGVIDGPVGETIESASITFNASAFRDSVVSCSGGPATISTRLNRLKPTSKTTVQWFWRWNRSGPGAGNGEPYTLEVPVWTWNGAS